MRNLRLVSFGVSCLSLSGFWFGFFALLLGLISGASGEAAPKKSSIEKFFRNNHDPIVREYISKHFTGTLRTELDKAVYQYLTSDPDIQRLIDRVRVHLNLSAELTRRDLEGSLARAGMGGIRAPGSSRWVEAPQYQNELDLVREVVSEIGFSKKALQDLRVYILNDLEVNAFTYSGDPETLIDVVLFRGLLEELDRDELRAVIAHELGHIKSEHVLMEVTVRVIFHAAALVLFPDEEPQKMAWVESLNKTWHRHFKPMSQFKVIGGGQGVMLDEAQDENFLLELSNLAELFAKQNAEKLPMILEDLMRHFYMQGNLADIVSKRPKSSQPLALFAKALRSKTPHRALELLNFDQIAESLSRSMEQTSDNHAIVVAGPRATERSVVRLVGGPQASVEGMKSQGREFFNRPHFYAYNLQNQLGDNHPGPVSRVAYPEDFEKRLEYRFSSDPFFRALDLYFRLSYDLKKSFESIHSDSSRPHTMLQASALRSYYTRVAAELKNALMEELVAELEKVRTVPRKSSLRQFEKLLTYLEITQHPIISTPFTQELRLMRRELREEMGRPDRLMMDLSEEIYRLSETHSEWKEFYSLLLDQLLNHFIPSRRQGVLAELELVLKAKAQEMGSVSKKKERRLSGLVLCSNFKN